jgi:uncharacterized protein with GYD domain
MATYIVLGNFDRGTVSADINSSLGGAPSGGETHLSLEKLRKLEDANVRMDQFWLCTGAYDVVALLTATSHEAALTFLAAAGFVANVSTTTLTAIDEDKIAQIFDDAHTKIMGVV